MVLSLQPLLSFTQRGNQSISNMARVCRRIMLAHPPPRLAPAPTLFMRHSPTINLKPAPIRLQSRRLHRHVPRAHDTLPQIVQAMR